MHLAEVFKQLQSLFYLGCPFTLEKFEQLEKGSFSETEMGKLENIFVNEDLLGCAEWLVSGLLIFQNDA